MLRKFDNKRNRIILSVLILLVVSFVIATVTFSSDVLNYEKSDVEILYDELLLQNDELINSDKYLVTDEFISRIPPNTSVEEFTSNINREDFVLTYDNVKVNEGLVKTGMVLTRGEESYTLVVAGDLNKDGLMNYVDTSAIIESAKVIPTDVVLGKASDFNEDGKYDKTDVTNSVDYSLNNKLELKKVIPVETKPTLEIVSGEFGENNWYRGDIVVNVRTNDSIKTSYKVIGTSTQSLVDVDDNHKITLSGYGAYKIIAWNYGEEGNRSNVTTMTFKIDDREIVPSVSYSTTDVTSKKVVATITFNKENVFITNNNEKNSVTFYKNGNFEFQYKDLTGRTGKITATVSWMEDAVGADGNWRYTYVNDEEIYLREYLGEVNENSEFVVPAEYDGYKVYGVGNNFEIEPVYNASFASFVISDGIKEIGANAFKYLDIPHDLVLPDSVEIIGDMAFEGVTIDGQLHLSKNLKSLGAASFYSVSFSEDLIIPDSVENIGAYAFSSAGSSGGVALSKSLKTIEEGIFSWSAFSGDLVIPDSVVSISDMAFDGACFDGTLTLPMDLEIIGNSAFSNSFFTGNLVIPDGVDSIGDRAFNYAGFDGTLTLGNNVKTIGDSSFEGTSFRGDLVMPDSVIEIGEAAFVESGFDGTLTLGENVKTIGESAFEDNNFSGDLVVPDSVEIIGARAFVSAGFNGYLDLGSSLELIGESAFTGNSFEGDLVIPDSVVSIGGSSFGGSGFDGTLTLGKNLKHIGVGSFDSTGFHGDLIIPDSVIEIGEYAFSCSLFDGTLNLSRNLEIIGKSAFADNNFTGEVIIPEKVTRIDAYVFANNSNLVGTIDASKFEYFDISAVEGTGVTVINYEE